MATTHDTGSGCFDPCMRATPDEVVEAGVARSEGIFQLDGTQIAPGGYTTGQIAIDYNRRIRISVPGAKIDACVPGPDQYIEYWRGGPGHGRVSIGAAGNISFGNFNGTYFSHNFGNPLGLNVDWGITPGSWNGNERLRVYGADEVVRGAGGSIVSGEDLPTAVNYSDGNSGAGQRFWQVNRQTNATLIHYPVGGLSSGFGFLWRRWPTKAVQLCECDERIEACDDDTTPRFHLGWEETNDPIDWFTPFDFEAAGAGWEFSSDAGLTWGPAPDTFTTLAAQSNGENRWRLAFTIPPGMAGWWRVRVEAEQPDGGGLPGVGYLDGDSVGTSNITNRNNSPSYIDYHYHTDYIPVEPGAHVFEWRENNITAGALSHPIFQPDYKAVMKDRKQLQIVDCLDDDGLIVSTDYYDAEGNLDARTPGFNWTLGLVP